MVNLYKFRTLQVAQQAGKDAAARGCGISKKWFDDKGYPSNPSEDNFLPRTSEELTADLRCHFIPLLQKHCLQKTVLELLQRGDKRRALAHHPS